MSKIESVAVDGVEIQEMVGKFKRRRIFKTVKELFPFTGLKNPIFLPNEIEICQILLDDNVVSEKVRAYGSYDADQDVYHEAHFEKAKIMPLSSQLEWLERVAMFYIIASRISDGKRTPKMFRAMETLSHKLGPGEEAVNHQDDLIGVIEGIIKCPECKFDYIITAALYVPSMEFQLSSGYRRDFEIGRLASRSIFRACVV